MARVKQGGNLFSSAVSNVASSWPVSGVALEPARSAALPAPGGVPRDVVWVVAGGRAATALRGLPGDWRLQRISPGDRASHQAVLEGARVGLLDLDGAVPRSVTNLVQAAQHINWIALIPPGSLVREDVRALIRECCYDFHTLPLDYGRLAVTLGRAYGMADLEAQDPAEEPDWGGGDGTPIIGASSAMMQLFKRLMRVADSDVPVLVQGESGTGKELAAVAVHRNSRRASGPFVAVNCGALPPQLIQSELFGHEAGAFTGATRRKLGQLELAHGGTLLLDEIGDLSLDLQVNLLRFLQEGTIWRLGGVQPVKVDVRVVAATHVDLADAIQAGRFREDLYYRLNVIQLDMPPLRDRGVDLMRLARFYLERFRHQRPRLRGFTQEAVEAMYRHAWPGNVRELVNRVQRAVTMADGRLVGPEDLGLKAAGVDAPRTLAEARARAERESVEQALRESGHNVSQAARRLGIGRVTLYRLINKYGITLPDRS